MIEMLIVITILVLFTGVIGINIGSALREQKFDSEVDLLVERLRLAQSLMLIMNRDVKLIVKPGKDNIELSMQVEGGIPDRWQFIVDRSHMVFTTIHSFLFDDLLGYPIEEGVIAIRFQSGGSVMSRGVIHLSTHEKFGDKGAYKRAIPLYGYPHPILSALEPLEYVNEDASYDLQVTEYTIQELKENEPNP